MLSKAPIIILFLALLQCSLLAQNTEIICQNIDKEVLFIDANLLTFDKSISNYSRTQQDSSYQEMFKNNNDQTVCLTIGNYDKTNIQIVKYYFKKSKFIYCIQTHWINGKAVNNEQLYFTDDKLIEWINTKGKSKDKSENDYAIANQDLANYAYSLVDNFDNITH